VSGIATAIKRLVFLGGYKYPQASTFGGY